MPAGGKGTAPKFVVWAVKDPTSGNLDRIQVVKGWTKNGQSFEKVFDVVWSGDRKPDKWTGRVPAIRSTVDLERATYTNDVGSAELKTVWTDPEFDASLHAFYYVRVLEIPTPRWTLIQAVKAGLPPPDVVPLTGQERAWTSPIWYAPSAEARKGAPAGMTVSALKQKGAVELNEAQVKALIAGKAYWVQNNVTGEQFSQNFTADGNTVVFRVGFNALTPSGTGKTAQDGYEGSTGRYQIQGGKLITWVAQEPYTTTFYKLGDTHYAARSNEFGYANYEIVAVPQFALNPLTALSNQFSTELGLTEEQRRQIVPILQEELKQLGELKKDTRLSNLQKAEALRKIGVSFDERISPLLNPEQQKKFQAFRVEMRRQIVEGIVDQAAQKVKSAVSAWFADAPAEKKR
jgi:ribosomal protein L15